MCSCAITSSQCCHRVSAPSKHDFSGNNRGGAPALCGSHFRHFSTETFISPLSMAQTLNWQCWLPFISPPRRRKKKKSIVWSIHVNCTENRPQILNVYKCNCTYLAPIQIKNKYVTVNNGEMLFSPFMWSSRQTVIGYSLLTFYFFGKFFVINYLFCLKRIKYLVCYVFNHMLRWNWKD